MRRTLPLTAARASLTAAALLFLSACSSMSIPWVSSTDTIEEPIDLVAIMPIEAGKSPDGEAGGEIEREAETVVTAAVYGALSSSYAWRFVPDLTVEDAMQGISPLDADARRAQALGKAVSADGVLFGSVWRFVERVGTPEEAESGASVGFTLRFLSLSSGEVVWEESYDETQESNGANWFNWMLFWEESPHWMTAAELTHVGIEHMSESLRRQLE